MSEILKALAPLIIAMRQAIPITNPRKGNCLLVIRP